MYKVLFISLSISLWSVFACAQKLQYPYPQQQFVFEREGKKTFMVYMDVHPATDKGRVIILFHGKNFNGYYFKDIIPVLLQKGYRVIVPELPGWGRSGKPDLHYSFHLLAEITKSLLDSLHINKTVVFGHSMGGMLATRFSLLYPALVEKLALENPIGLEDYKTFVPYQPLEKLYTKEKAATYESYKKYQQTYYPVWKPEYEQFVAAQAEALTDPGFDNIAWVNAVTYQMIYEQPVVYEFSNLTVPVLLIIGQADRTVVGKDLLPADQKNKCGLYPQLGRKTAAVIKNARLVELEDVGHIPHVQAFDKFSAALLSFL